MPEEPRLTLPHQHNGSTNAGTVKVPEQPLSKVGFIIFETPFGRQAISAGHIAGFGPCIVQDAPARPPRVELGKSTIMVQGIGPVAVNHDQSTVAQLIATHTPRV